MSYYSYENKAKNQTNIHVDSCGFIEQNEGDRQQLPHDGPYASLAEAEEVARQCQRRAVHYCHRTTLYGLFPQFNCPQIEVSTLAQYGNLLTTQPKHPNNYGEDEVRSAYGAALLGV